MKYKELTEINVSEWDGKQFMALACDNADCELSITEMQILSEGDTSFGYSITGYNNGNWLTSGNSCTWKHVYPIYMNHIEARRMTNRELSKWLAKGNGQVCKGDATFETSCHDYNKVDDDKEVPAEYRVRTWDSKEWVIPTISLIK